MVTYYRDMWPRRSHILAPLTDLLGTSHFVWEAKHRDAFMEMKALMARDTLLAYLDHNREFFIETDASDYQLGGRIFQVYLDQETGKEIQRDVAFYTRKLSSAQQNNSTIEKEMLSVVEVLKEYGSMLLGAHLSIYMDQKDLTYKLSQYSTQ